MSKLEIELPTETVTLAIDITIERATELVVEYVHKYDLHFDIDASYTDDSGTVYQFDFEREQF